VFFFFFFKIFSLDIVHHTTKVQSIATYDTVTLTNSEC